MTDDAPRAEYTPQQPSAQTERVPESTADLEALLRASRAAEQLHARFAEILRREEELDARQTHIEQLVDNARSDAKEFDEFRAREQSSIRTQRQHLEEQTASLEAMRSELEQLRIDLERGRSEIDAARNSYRVEVQRDLEVERAAIRQLQSTLQQEREKLSVLEADARREQQAALASVQDQLQVERQKLEQSIREELSSEAADFRREKTEWDAQRAAQREELKRDSEELQREREQFTLQQQHERDAFHRDCDRRGQEFQQEQSVLRRRARFQLDHLEQSRAEFQTELQSFRRTRQRFGIEREQDRQLIRLRLRQLARYRDLLEQREASVDRERTILERMRAVQSVESDRDRKRLSEARQDWNREREAGQSELRWQQDVLAMHAENLERRRQRLEQLRSEVENGHASTLQDRIAVEETLAQLAQIDDGEQSQQRTSTARQALSEHYDRLRNDLLRDREELDAFRVELDRCQDKFRRERQSLTEWVAQHDERLRQREERLRIETAATDRRESQWRQARDCWKHERAEAEAVIRDLLDQLTEHAAAELVDSDSRLVSSLTLSLDDENTDDPTDHDAESVTESAA